MDIRFPPTVSMSQMEDIIKKWTSEEVPLSLCPLLIVTLP